MNRRTRCIVTRFHSRLLVLLSLGILFCIIGRNPYIYILGIWVLLTDSPKNFGFQHLNLLIPTHKKKIVGSGKINKVVNILPGCREIERREISPATMPDYLIPMVDGVYNLQTETLEPHSHFNTFLYRVNASYNDPRYYNESGDYFDAFMDRTFFNDPEGRITFQEICGIALTNISLYLKCGFFFVGEPDSGKSVALRLIESLIDDDFISHVSFQQLGNRFGVDQLNGMHLNTSGEMSTITNKEFSKFKMITGGDKLMVENKGKDGFTMINTAMLLFACNNLPIVDNPDSAYYRRMCILRFKNSIPEEDQIQGIDELICKYDRGHLVKFAIEGAKRFLNNGKMFSYRDKLDEERQSYKHSANSFAEFASIYIKYDERNTDFRLTRLLLIK